jgi:hypothetical protein
MKYEIGEDVTVGQSGLHEVSRGDEGVVVGKNADGKSNHDVAVRLKKNDRVYYLSAFEIHRSDRIPASDVSFQEILQLTKKYFNMVGSDRRNNFELENAENAYPDHDVAIYLSDFDNLSETRRKEVIDKLETHHLVDYAQYTNIPNEEPVDSYFTLYLNVEGDIHG